MAWFLGQAPQVANANVGNENQEHKEAEYEGGGDNQDGGVNEEEREPRVEYRMRAPEFDAQLFEWHTERKPKTIIICKLEIGE